MPKTVSISWLKQRSGSYALKGITIYKDVRVYDSTATFRDEDARWVTKMLGAQPRIELSGIGMSQRSSDDYPGWALEMEERETDGVGSPALDRERAGATILRHSLDQLVERHITDNGDTLCNELVEGAKSALLVTNAGTYYTLEEAHSVLDRHERQAARFKKKL
jgi:hypothetical protein